MDCFDCLPDSIIIDIFNAVSDVKTLTCCRAVSRRFNALVPHADALLLRVDRVVPQPDTDSLLLSFFRNLLTSVHHFLSPHPAPEPPNYPTRVLRGFARIRDLEIELPSGDLRLEKGAVVKYRAVFGERLRSCVILGFRHWRGAGEAQDGFGEGLKERVAWIVSAGGRVGEAPLRGERGGEGTSGVGAAGGEGQGRGGRGGDGRAGVEGGTITPTTKTDGGRPTSPTRRTVGSGRLEGWRRRRPACTQVEESDGVSVDLAR